MAITRIGASPRTMSTLARVLRRRATALLAAGLLAAGLAVAATPGTASAVIDPPGVRVTFLVPSGWVDTTIGGDWFDGLVTVSNNFPPTADGTNAWTWGLQKTGPDGQTYRRLHHVAANECLTHESGILFTRTCSLTVDSQWWAVEEFPCLPNAPICFPHLLKPLDKPGHAVRNDGGLMVLEPRNGPSGAHQKVYIFHRS